MINEEIISKFLEGKNPQKYIVNVEIPYGSDNASLVINDPERGKYISNDKLTSFLWFKEEVTKIMYGGKRNEILKATKKFGITIVRLKTNVNDASTPFRMETGYKFMAKTTGSFTKIINFFKQGGVDIYGSKHKEYFIVINPVEQYLIGSGKRLFKGFEDYDNLHRLQFDLETTSLSPKGTLLSQEERGEILYDISKDSSKLEDYNNLYEFDKIGNPLRLKDGRIFQIGVRDNRGFEEILEISQDPDADANEQEAYLILRFFEIIKKLQPDTIAGYNSENFDWEYIFTRCEILGLDIELIAKTLDKTGENKIKRVDKTLKLGGETEYCKQTVMYGYNILDVYHAVRRAKAINSNIKSAGLKYITKFSKLNKPNRVYIEGNQIHTMWNDLETVYAFNDEDGTYYTLSEDNPLKEGYQAVKGNYIVRRYLLDDLWETEKVDEVYNQASFLLSKIIPTTYMRSTTMGTASVWKLIMLAWSYENRLAIPNIKSKENFTGGLSRLLEVGYAKNVSKLDYAALYPNIELTWDVFPNVDISGVMKGMLLYIASTRDKYKGLMNEHKAEASKISELLEENGDKMTDEERSMLKKEMERHKSLASLYDKKQLPIKILGNSFFGSLGAPNIFPWGDTNCAEETTCRGRQYLRLMVKFFMDYGFKPLVGDTDGFNFAIPENINIRRYTPKGTHRFTEEDKGKELEGLKAVVAEFNELYMIGRMGLDIDDICESTINFSRKNYANLIDGKIKLVGNTIKSSKLPTYIEEFLEEGIKHLLNGDGYEFIQLYNKTVDNIYNFRIPLIKIASKAKVKESISTYLKECNTKTAAGNFKARKAHMELLLANNIKANLGDTIYYVNTGTVKSHGDVKVVTNKETGERSVVIQSKLIPTEEIESDAELITTEYNVAKYLDMFNKRIHPLLVCFKPEIRDSITIDLVKNKKTKEMELTDIKMFTLKQCELDSGNPFKDEDQNTISELMDMEDKEIEFWMRMEKEPNNLSDLGMDWNQIQKDYFNRKKLERINGIQFEKDECLKLIKRLEVSDYEKMKKTTVIPASFKSFAEFTVHEDKNGKPNIFIISNKWGVDLCSLDSILKYEPWANQRAKWYMLEPNKKLHNFEDWLKSVWIESKHNNDTNKANAIEKELNLAGIQLETEDYIDMLKTDEKIEEN